MSQVCLMFVCRMALTVLDDNTTLKASGVSGEHCSGVSIGWGTTGALATCVLGLPY